jgi:hypothetical protein
MGLPYKRALMRGAVGPSIIDNILSTGPVAYYPMNETSGTAAVNAEGTANRNGTYQGATLGQFKAPFTCPFFDGINDFLRLDESVMAAPINKNLGSMAGWARVYDAGVWSDETWRYLWNLEYISNANTIRLAKPGDLATQDRIYSLLRQGTNIASTTSNALTTTGWIHIGLTWDVLVQDELKLFVQGGQEGGTQTGLVTPSGSLTYCAIGAKDYTPINTWHGWLAHWAIWDYVLAPSEMQLHYSWGGV